MKILLLGGTGAMGKYLNNFYSACNENEVYITSRKKRVSEKSNVHYIEGNAKSLEFLKLLAQKKWDIIVDFMIYSEQEFKERIYFLLDITERYIFLSSARVYALSDGVLNEESDRLLDVCKDKKYIVTNEYALEKAREENVLFESGKMNWTIIRPYVTYDGYRLQLGIYEKENWLYRVLHGRTLVVTDDIMDNITTLTYGEDVAHIIYNVSLSEKGKGQVVQAVSPNFIQWENVLETYRRCLLKLSDTELKVKRVKSINCLNEVFSRYQLKYDRLGKRLFNSSKAESYGEINWTSIEDGVESSLDIFINKPEWKDINWKSEALMDKITGEKTDKSEMPDLKTRLVYWIYRYTPYSKLVYSLKRLKRVTVG